MIGTIVLAAGLFCAMALAIERHHAYRRMRRRFSEFLADDDHDRLLRRTEIQSLRFRHERMLALSRAMIDALVQEPADQKQLLELARLFEPRHVQPDPEP